ncbi:MAG: AbrB/MazE/SpoVT family DNA-binding domain-containing protein [Candidatus Brockarchaeota archaeon]|nr:AbrB/MazE/SpoVT family DNA-binding domain-containing protein [Candidatus Brockarchaeota archaeon]
MTEVNVSPKWQVVIPREVRRKAKGLRRGGRVEVRLEGERIIITPVAESVARSLYGLGHHIWEGTEPVKYQKKLRMEWKGREKSIGL